MRTVWIIGGSERTSRVLAEQVQSCVQDRAVVVGVSVDSVMPVWKPDDIIVVSSSLIIGNLADVGITVPQEQLIIGRRTVNPDKLESVVALPPGTNVVFINDTQETTEACVQSLLELGINYVQWHIWYPGLDVFPYSVCKFLTKISRRTQSGIWRKLSASLAILRVRVKKHNASLNISPRLSIA